MNLEHERSQRVEMCQNERSQRVEICQNERSQRVEICQTADISTNTVLSTDCSCHLHVSFSCVIYMCHLHVSFTCVLIISDLLQSACQDWLIDTFNYVSYNDHRNCTTMAYGKGVIIQKLVTYEHMAVWTYENGNVWKMVASYFFILGPQNICGLEDRKIIISSYVIQQSCSD